MRQKTERDTLDCITKKYTAFSCFLDLLYARGGYRPSLDTGRFPRLVTLADAYDAWQETAGDKRRAYRF